MQLEPEITSKPILAPSPVALAEIFTLSRCRPAIVLLAFLRTHHPRPGEAFPIVPEAIGPLLPNRLSPNTVRKARDFILGAGLLDTAPQHETAQTNAGRGRPPILYTLKIHSETP
jgi:hypothetical protein